MSDDSEIVVEGHWAVEALIASGRFEIRLVLVESGRHPDLVEVLEKGKIPHSILSAEELRSVAGYDFHRGVMAHVVRPHPSGPTVDFLVKARRLVAPVRLADPGNVGTIIRTAVAFGADGILIEKGKGADPWGRKSIRASARAIFRVPIFEVENLEETLLEAGKHHFSIFGTSLSEEASPLREVKPVKKSIILFGAEKEGLSGSLHKLCDQLIGIPMANEMDSLNVAASAAIVCHDLFVPR
ncbi:MAG: RNA methyltransferase [Verrucomicrobiales bacterium]|nr:RNA methyltransferase [Verrucomicrobiales bacterium]